VVGSQSVLPQGTSLEPFAERSALSQAQPPGTRAFSCGGVFSAALPEIRDGALRSAGACVGRTVRIQLVSSRVGSCNRCVE
jgi:hypothetical protein